MAPPLPRQDWALFIDIDGTLLDLAPTPDAVIVPDGLRETLTGLQDSFGGAVALVSGRAMVMIDKLFAPLILPASGQHGAELRLGAERLTAAPHPAMPAIAVALDTFAAAHPGIHIENKGDSIAVHYRAAPAMAERAREIAERLIANAENELEVLPGKMVVDIKRRVLSKGSAIAWFMARPPFAGRVPLFAGDDITDEYGFAAVNERGGVSIRVGPDAPTAASFCMASPAALREWLATLIRC